MNNSWQRYLIHLFILLILGSYGFTWVATDRLETIVRRIPAIEAKLDLLLEHRGLPTREER